MDLLLSSAFKCRTNPDNFSGAKTTAHHDLYESRWLRSTPQSTLRVTMKTSAGLAARGGCIVRNSQRGSAMYNWVCSWLFDVEVMRYLAIWVFVCSARRTSARIAQYRLSETPRRIAMTTIRYCRVCVRITIQAYDTS